MNRPEVRALDLFETMIPASLSDAGRATFRPRLGSGHRQGGDRARSCSRKGSGGRGERFPGGTDVVDQQKSLSVQAPARAMPGSEHEDVSNICRACGFREPGLRLVVYTLSQTVSYRNASRAMQRRREKFSLVVPAPSHFLRMHRHRDDRIEEHVVALLEHLVKETAEGAGEKVVSPELESVKEPLQAVAIVSPRVDPYELPVAIPTGQTGVSVRLRRPVPRAGADTASRLVDPGEVLPALHTAGVDPITPGKRPITDDTVGRQNDSGCLTSQ